MSLYSEYLKERTSDEILEKDYGFITWRYIHPKTVYIVDLFVKKESRELGRARDLVAYVMETAKGKGCDRLLGSICPYSRGSDSSIRMLMNFGMIIHSSDQNLVYFERNF